MDNSVGLVGLNGMMYLGKEFGFEEWGLSVNEK